MKYDYAIERLKDMNQGKEMEFYCPDGRWRTDEQPELTRIEKLNSPIGYRTKPTPRKVPWGPEDVKPGMVFKHQSWPTGWSAPVSVTSLMVHWAPVTRVKSLTYNELKLEWLYSLDGKTWFPCEKDEVIR